MPPGILGTNSVGEGGPVFGSFPRQARCDTAGKRLTRQALSTSVSGGQRLALEEHLREAKRVAASAATYRCGTISKSALPGRRCFHGRVINWEMNIIFFN